VDGELTWRATLDGAPITIVTWLHGQWWTWRRVGVPRRGRPGTYGTALRAAATALSRIRRDPHMHSLMRLEMLERELLAANPERAREDKHG